MPHSFVLLPLCLRGLSNYVPDNPFTIFMSSYHHTGDLLADHGNDDGGHLLIRMIFSHQVTALEAYLGDTLMNEVMADKAAMQRLIDQDENLAKEKFTLAEISKDPGLVKGKVRERERSSTTISRRSMSSTTLPSGSAS